MHKENSAPGAVSLGSLIHTDKQRLIENCPEYISTGFKEFDKNLGGGLTPNLFVLGAASSVGKSTFILQIAHNIANQGYPVLFFSLEMPAQILAEKGMLCQLYIKYGDKIPHDLFTCRQTMERFLANKQDKAVLYKAISEFEKSAADIYVIDRTESGKIFSFSDIERYTADFKKKHSKTPVIIVDYLQLLHRDEKYGMTDKQIVDRNISDLWSLSHRMKTPVIVISSINRTSYNTPMRNSAFKESGSIEFSADILLGLQIQKNQNTKGENADRLLELIILKNRFGASQCRIPMKFHARYGFFEEIKSRNPADREGKRDEERI
ncbi:MAG: hypothetical protein IJ642_01820 [Oscillospiraceae bacterium]|nr:hypothetical protein [Oscillospiraceae bacterium]